MLFWPRTDVAHFPGYVFSTESNTAGYPRNRTPAPPSQPLQPTTLTAFLSAAFSPRNLHFFLVSLCVCGLPWDMGPSPSLRPLSFRPKLRRLSRPTVQLHSHP